MAIGSKVILFSELLKSFFPKHDNRRGLLFTQFSCGCKSSIAYGDDNTHYIKNIENSSLIGDCSSCSLHREIDFSEFKEMRFKSSMAIVTEIFGFNSISRSLRKKESSQKKGDKK